MLEELINKSLVWTDHAFTYNLSFRETGYKTLDQILPGGGWPKHGLTEIFSEKTGMGALRLVLPLIARMTRAQKKVIFVNPPYIPFPSALSFEGLELSNLIIINPPCKNASRGQEILRIYEDALKVEDCSIVLAWLSNVLFKDSRKLSLAALAGKSWGVTFLPFSAVNYSSSSTLRISSKILSSSSGLRGLKITLLKACGEAKGKSVCLEL